MAVLTQIVLMLSSVCIAASYVPNIIIITADDIVSILKLDPSILFLKIQAYSVTYELVF